MAFPHVADENGNCVQYCIGYKFSDVVLSYKQWTFDFFEHVILVVLAVVIVSRETKYKTSAYVFLCIQIADGVDYILTYGESWTDGPITFNTLKCAIFGVSIAFDIVKTIANGRTVEANK